METDQERPLEATTVIGKQQRELDQQGKKRRRKVPASEQMRQWIAEALGPQPGDSDEEAYAARPGPGHKLQKHAVTQTFCKASLPVSMGPPQEERAPQATPRSQKLPPLDAVPDTDEGRLSRKGLHGRLSEGSAVPDTPLPSSKLQTPSAKKLAVRIQGGIQDPLAASLLFKRSEAASLQESQAQGLQKSLNTAGHGQFQRFHEDNCKGGSGADLPPAESIAHLSARGQSQQRASSSAIAGELPTPVSRQRTIDEAVNVMQAPGQSRKNSHGAVILDSMPPTDGSDNSPNLEAAGGRPNLAAAGGRIRPCGRSPANQLLDPRSADKDSPRVTPSQPTSEEVILCGQPQGRDSLSSAKPSPSPLGTTMQARAAKEPSPSALRQSSGGQTHQDGSKAAGTQPIWKASKRAQTHPASWSSPSKGPTRLLKVAGLAAGLKSSRHQPAVADIAQSVISQVHPKELVPEFSSFRYPEEFTPTQDGAPDGKDHAAAGSSPPKCGVFECSMGLQVTNHKTCSAQAAALCKAGTGQEGDVPDPDARQDESDAEDEVQAGIEATQPDIFTQAGGKQEQLGAPSLNMADYLIPDIVRVFEADKLHQLYRWQADCLHLPGVLSKGRNLVYSAPTGAGKSAVAEVLTLYRCYLTHKIALFVLPFVALCEQKALSLTNLLAPMSLGVKSYFGNLSKLGVIDKKSTGAIVCTIEKANTLVNKLLEENSLNDFISTVIVDELHMVGEDDRGYVLELLLTKLRYKQLEGSYRADPSEPSSLQLIGMSATMPNADQVASWLGAELYQTSFRPTPLHLYLKRDKDLLDPELNIVRQLNVSQNWDQKADPDLTAWLTRETVEAGHSVLIFCGTKKDCEKVAELIAEAFEIADVSQKRAAVTEKLSRVSNNTVLQRVIKTGVAFHSSNLNRDEREVIEAGYLSGGIRVIAATMTLAAGVNLPARRVIVKHYWVGSPQQWLTTTQFQQMAGRAGRAGFDTHGEVVLICPPRDNLTQFANLVKGDARRVESSLHKDRKGMSRALMEVIASKTVSNHQDIQRYVGSTLLAATQDAAAFQQEAARGAHEALTWLRNNGFIQIFQDPENPERGGIWRAQELGKAACASGLTPQQALMVKDDLKRAMDELVLSGDLHLTFLVTPPTEDILSLVGKNEQSQWLKFGQAYTTVESTPALYRIAKACGIKQAFVERMRSMRKPRAEDAEQVRLSRRFFAALTLLQLINEQNPRTVERQFGLPEKALDSLKDRAAGFAGMVAAFSQQLGYDKMELLIAKFQERVQHGVMPELIDLARIQGVKGYRARQLYSAGLRTVKDVAECEVAQIEAILGKGMAGKNEGVQPREAALRIRKSARRLLRQDTVDYLKEHGMNLALNADLLRLVEASTAASGGDSQLEEPPRSATGLQKSAEKPSSDASRRPAIPVAVQPRPPAGQTAASSGNSARLQPATASGQPPSRGENSMQAAVATPASLQQSAPSHSRNASSASIARCPGPSRLGLSSLNMPADNAPGRPTQQGRFIVKLETDMGKLQQMEQALRGCRLWAFDFHVSERAQTNPFAAPFGLLHKSPDKAALFIHSVGFACEVGIWVVDLKQEFLDTVVRLLSSSQTKLSFRLKQQLLTLHMLNGVMEANSWPKLAVAGPVIDVRVAQWLLTPDRSEVSDSPEETKTYGPPLCGLDCLFKLYPAGACEAALVGFSKADLKSATTWSPGVRAAAALALFGLQERQLVTKDLMAPLLRIEMPLVSVLCDMERAGICLDTRMYKRSKAALQRRQTQLDELMADEVGEEVDASSSKQVCHILFDVLGLAVPISKKTKRGNPSTAADALAEIDHPVARYIIEYRQITKVLEDLDSYSTQGEGRRVPGPLGAEGEQLRRISPSWLQTGSETGRISVESPNMQCVQKPRTFLVPNTQHHGSRVFEANLRSAFPAQPGWTMVSGDYRQQELRIMAHFSGDEKLCSILSAQGDPFTLIAAQWFAVEPEEVSEATRNEVKALVYGLNYGMGAFALARKMDCSMQKAKDYLDGLHGHFPQLYAWTQQVVEDCKARPDCSIETISGRRRYLPRINDRDSTWSAEAARKARNTVPQGSAADIIKIAMITLQKKIKEQLPGACNLLLMIHDELVIEVENSCLAAAAKLLKASMEEAWQLKVPLEVQLRAGRSWGELQPYEG